MFEGRDDVLAVAAQGAMIAVMQHHDVPVRPVRARDACEPLDQALRRLRLPVPANFRPHHHTRDSRAARFPAQQRAAVAIGRTHPSRRPPRGGRYCRLASLQFAANSHARLQE